MVSDDMTDQHWEAARIAVYMAFREDLGLSPELGEPKGILKFLDYHFGLLGAGHSHNSSITLAVRAISRLRDGPQNPLTVECIRNFNCASPSFVRGVRLIMRPDSRLGLRKEVISLVSLASDQWFNSPVPFMRPEEMSEFCEHLTMFMVEEYYYGSYLPTSSATILFGMLRSSEWRKHVVPNLWSVFSRCNLVEEEEESFRQWCLQNAMELLDFTRGLTDGQELRWWHARLLFHHDKLDTPVQDEVERIKAERIEAGMIEETRIHTRRIEAEIATERLKAARINTARRVEIEAERVEAERVEVERILSDMPRGGYPNRLEREATKMRKGPYHRRSESEESSESGESSESDVESRNRSVRNIYSIYSPPVDRQDWHVRVQPPSE